MNNKNHIFILILVLISTLFMFWVFSKYSTHEEKAISEELLDSYLRELADKVEQVKELALTTSVLLSKNVEIKKCLQTADKDNCLEYLQKSIYALVNIPAFDDLRIHIHDKNINSFFRLWDLGSSNNDSLVSFRHSLSVVKEQKKSLACIEVGRFSMLIRGISPVMDGAEYIGKLEVITGFNGIVEYFNQKNIKLYILMKSKYKDIANKVSFTKEQQLKNYYIINKINENTMFLNDIDFRETGYLNKSDYYLLYTPIYDINYDSIGFYVLKIYKK